MNWDAFWVILSRWVHVVSACLALGGVFFMRVVVPLALSALDPPEARHAVFLRLRRVFKMVIHSCILLFLVSGTYNSVHAWHQYNLWPELLHALWGVHVLGALVVFGLALYVLAGKEPPPTHMKWMAVNLGLLFVIVAAAATLKYAREATVAGNSASTLAAVQGRINGSEPPDAQPAEPTTSPATHP